jgi:hypothetical protein
MEKANTALDKLVYCFVLWINFSWQLQALQEISWRLSVNRHDWTKL